MIDNPISEDWFLKACKDIHRNDYEDIIVERFISKLCGYPLCLNSVSNVPRQKYAISTKTNKVYDITERKYFCSAKCFKESNYVKEQLSTTPLWLLKEEDKVNIVLFQDVKPLEEDSSMSVE
ncbi:putative RNA polymerase II subunit B1 CTD phosphatase RPAP2 homolog isoform X1 [Centruroides sculpturatus]|uniref:putative RNA polymerase II subunit B1 CTD phosphatase RPAP2 homolog isoform X1 n=1 Tax=Centruroides sculpturatus TaxID=218467 RepID=UPI000C6D9626|nr:putative RNA polymerase II subunit B1 CTD phosphatase RPAP2 homolog isoform X1 [Centruroides sculpturatus]